jgi:hypothetical protein
MRGLSLRTWDWRRLSAWALLLALPLLTGGLDLHPHGEPLSGGALRAGESYAPEAVHPDLPHHFEAGSTAQRPVCPVCLFHLAISGGHLLAVAGVAPAPLAGRLLASEDFDLQRGLTRHCPSRGPPSLSYLV